MKNRLKVVIADLQIIVPKAQVCSKSLYFENACQNQDDVLGTWMTDLKLEGGETSAERDAPKLESQEYKFTSHADEAEGGKAGKSQAANVVELKGVHSEIFSIFLAWAVTGTLEESVHYIIDESISKERAFMKSLQLIQCYILGEKIQAEDFRNHVMDHIVKNEKYLLLHFRSSSLVYHVVDNIYKNTSVDSSLRRFMVELTIATVPKYLESLIPDQNPCVEYVRECFRQYQIWACDMPHCPWDKHACHYHDHSNRPTGYKCRK